MVALARLSASFRKNAVCLGLFLATSISPGWLQKARAQSVDVAPGAARAWLRQVAATELESAVNALPYLTQRSLSGVYVAFDDSVTDVSAMAACDDDGDDVVVVSDALLTVASFVAEAEASDETCGAHRVAELAHFLRGAKEEVLLRKGVRPLPPPRGFFDACPSQDAQTQDRAYLRFREIVASIVDHELVHFVEGNLRCPHPTSTHESGDDDWTPSEREQAVRAASEFYSPERTTMADALATALLLESGHTELGSLSWLETIESLERPGDAAPYPLAWTYLGLHRVASSRRTSVGRAAAEWRQLHATIVLPRRQTESKVAPKTH
jgi:hypothetical protein